jgi:hypothetical protein
MKKFALFALVLFACCLPLAADPLYDEGCWNPATQWCQEPINPCNDDSYCYWMYSDNYNECTACASRMRSQCGTQWYVDSWYECDAARSQDVPPQ